MKTIYVGNLPFSATEQDVRDFFSPCKIKRVRMILDRETDKPRGFCFIEIDDEDLAGALALHNGDFGGRSAVVNEATPRPPRRAKQDR